MQLDQESKAVSCPLLLLGATAFELRSWRAPQGSFSPSPCPKAGSALSFFSSCVFTEVSISYRFWEQRFLFYSRPKSFIQPAGSERNTGEMLGEETRTMGRKSPFLRAAFLFSRARIVSVGLVPIARPILFCALGRRRGRAGSPSSKRPAEHLWQLSSALDRFGLRQLFLEVLYLWVGLKNAACLFAQQENLITELTLKKVPFPAASPEQCSLETIFPF